MSDLSTLLVGTQNIYCLSKFLCLGNNALKDLVQMLD